MTAYQEMGATHAVMHSAIGNMHITKHGEM